MQKSPSENLDGINRLAFNGKIFLFNCEQASTTNVKERKEFVLCSYSFKPELNDFLRVDDGTSVIDRKRSSRASILKCQCTLDTQRRCVTTCVLLSKKSDKDESFHYCLLTLNTSNQLEPCIEFKLPYQLSRDVSILQGPTVLWSHAGRVFYTSVQTGEVRPTPFQLSNSLYGQLPLCKGKTFVLGVQGSTGQSLAYFLENGHIFDPSVLLPLVYVFITECILVLSADQVDDVLTTTVVAATSNQQLVYFENGTVKETCQVPFELPTGIQVADTGRDGLLFVISFRHGHVCAIWKNTFQIASSWSGVSSVHVDNFLGCGTDQILLLLSPDGVTERPLENFIITDLCGISYSRGGSSGEPSMSLTPSDSRLFTVEALESRLQSGLSTLQELQSQVGVKERVLNQSLQAFTQVVSEKEPAPLSHIKEGLIGLWDSDDESKDESWDDKDQDMPAVSSKPQIDRLWHRFAEDRMIVGVILTTDGSVPAASVSLSILTERGQSSTPAVIQTQSQVFWLPMLSPSSSSSSSSASMFSEPAAKRSKQHNAGGSNDLNIPRLAVTAVTWLTPLLNSACVKCHVIVHYVQRKDALVSNPTPVVLGCGEVAVDIHQDFNTQLLKNPELIADEVQEDLLSLLALLDHQVFFIDSPEHSLGDINGWIKKRGDWKRIEVNPEYLICNSSGPSALMVVRWLKTSPFQGELSVHCSHLQMLQFLDSLLDYLPGTCSIQPVKRRGFRDTQTFSLALEKEVVSLRDFLPSLLCCAEEDEEITRTEPVEIPEPGSLEGLQRCRQVWQQDVERSRMRLSPLLDVGGYRKLTQSLSEVQLQGDLSALVATR